MSRAPVRLLETRDVPEAERALLEVGRSHPPVGYDVDAGAARFRASVAGLAAAGVATAARGAVKGVGGKTLFAKVVAKVLLSVAVGSTFVGVGMVAGVMMARHAAREDRPIALAPPSVAPVAVQPSALASAPALANAPTPELANAPTPEPALSTPHHRSRHTSASIADPEPAISRETTLATQGATEPATAAAAEVQATAPTAAPPHTDPSTPPPAAEPARPLSELQGIAMARGLVARDPGAALGVLDRLRKEHPNGYFVEEREALTVLALAGDGQLALAKQQGHDFLRVFPKGPFSDQVREVLAR